MGGNNENMANSIVCPATVAPFVDTTKRLLSLEAVVPGASVKVICFHALDELNAAVVDPRTAPDEDCSAMVNVPEIGVEGADGNR